MLGLALKTGDRCLRADYRVANLDKELRVLWNENIDTRAELDKSHYAILLNVVARLHIRYDAASHKACNLANEHLTIILKADNCCGTLVLG